MSKYSIEFCTDREIPEWIVVQDVYTKRQVTIGAVVFKSVSREQAEAILEELQTQELIQQYNAFNYQESEFDTL